MKWHKFLVYFAMWAGAAIQVINGARLLTGAVYGDADTAEQVYAYFQGVKAIDRVFGVLFFAAAAFMIHTRFQLAGFKKGAPTRLLACYGINLVLNLAYPLILSASTGVSLDNLMDASFASSIASSVALIFVNRAYYQKRAHLFEETPYAGSESASGTQPYAVPSGHQVKPGSFGGGTDGSSGRGAGVLTSKDNAGSGASAVRTRYCTRCGKKAEAVDHFCTGCGQRLE